MSNNPLTETPTPSDADLRAFVVALYQAFRGDLYPRDAHGNIVPSGPAGDGVRPSIGAPTNPFEAAYINRLLIGGAAVNTAGLANTATVLHYDTPGEHSYVWPDDGRANALVILHGGGTGGADRRNHLQRNIAANTTVIVTVGAQDTSEASRSAIKFGSAPAIKTGRGTTSTEFTVQIPNVAANRYIPQERDQPGRWVVGPNTTRTVVLTNPFAAFGQSSGEVIIFAF